MTKSTLSIKSFFGAAIGTMIEYYDYALFVMFMPIIAPVFFSAHNAYQSLSKMFYAVLIASLARPFGAIFFGYFGDYYGRRNALLLSMYGIALATFLIGMIPSSTTIGVWAGLLALTAKTVQVFCFAGEYNGAGIYVVEHANQKREGLIGSLVAASTTLGAVLASMVGVVLTADGMPSWSWRIGFMFGGLVGAFGIFYRKKMLEVPRFVKANPVQHNLIRLMKDHPRELLCGIFIGGLSSVPATTVIGFITPVLMAKGFLTSHQLMWFQTFLNIIAIVAVITVGFITDRLTPYKIMRFACILYMLLTYPLLLILDKGQFYSTFFVLAGFLVMSGIFFAPTNAYYKDLFSMQFRYRGSSLSCCIGISLFGGLTPVIENALYQSTGQFNAIAIWIISISFITYCVFPRRLEETKRNTEILPHTIQNPSELL